MTVEGKIPIDFKEPGFYPGDAAAAELRNEIKQHNPDFGAISVQEEPLDRGCTWQC